MRKGFSLLEMMVIIAVIALLSIPLARLSTTTIRDIPRLPRIIQANTSLLNALKQIQRDINVAKGFPDSFGTFSADNGTLLIELEDSTICYQLKNGQLLRQTLANAEPATEDKIMKWPVPHGKIRWRLWQKNGKSYAVEIKTYIEQKTAGRLQKKLANSYVYFVDAYQQPIE